MLSKKLFVGVAAVALAFSTAAVASAASPKDEAVPNDVQYQEKISVDGEGGISFSGADKDNLPEGVTYQDEISMDGEPGGALSFDIDVDELPEGVHYSVAVSEDAEGGIKLK